ncbi:hypothetical protein [Amycolatopsis methanolica]|uniref:hypothetical protein n=1 Tax=Amycolatopsis methanolica TaxID=1814 RepID=UPI00343F0BB4
MTSMDLPGCVRPLLVMVGETFAGGWTAVEPARLRAECEEKVATLVADVGIPRPWSINEFLDRLEAYRGREIDLCAVRWRLGQSTGAWQRHEDFDVIAYPENPTGAHQDHVILHELGHMFWEHPRRCVLSLQEVQQLAPSLGAAALGHLLNPAAAAADEYVAETFATLMLARIRAAGRVQPGDELAQRVRATFG